MTRHGHAERGHGTQLVLSAAVLVIVLVFVIEEMSAWDRLTYSGHGKRGHGTQHPAGGN